jgi:two-component system sensor histidine kinase VicK
MRIHFFSRVDKKGRFAFCHYYILQNLKTVKIISVIYFILCILIRVLFSAYGLNGHHISHIDDYNAANWIGLFITPAFYIASRVMLKKFSKRRKVLLASQSLACMFAIFIIISSMRATFFSMYNPRNTLVMYLMGTITVAVFFTLEYYETMAITIIAGLVFFILLPFYQHTINELVLNNLASLILLATFFSISRYLFSYRADNFFKLKAIEEKTVEIENASLVKNEILGIVAHDLRNPLAIIKSAAGLMELEGYDNDEIDNYIRMIHASCDKANAIINDLIETAQNEFNDAFELTDTNINLFLSTTVEEWLKNKKEQVGIVFYDSPHTIYSGIQPAKMHRVMDNLISNALKFSGENSHIEVRLSDSDDDVFISVRDFGIGIPKEHLPHIFDRFSKARRNGLRGESAVGLGLSIVHQIIKKHCGEIVVESLENGGTTFTITLPKIIFS